MARYDSDESPSSFSEEDNEMSEENIPAGPAITKKVTSKEKTIEERYQKKTQLEHILLRPDTYVGSLEPETSTCWIWNDDEERMVQKTVTIIPAMYKIFDEIIVNAADVKARELHEKKGSKIQKMTKLEVDIDEENARISILNDGAGIPVEIHREHKVYVPELIFGHLLTSDNYDDTDQRVTGGRNGYGAKLTNIFSEMFEVEVVDAGRRKKFHMRWMNNMGSHTDPRITETSLKADYVKISFRPDLTRFKTEGLGGDLVAIMKKRVYDIAGTTGVKVMLNGKRLPIKDFKSYVDLYFLRPKAERQAAENDELVNLSQSSQTSNKDSDFLCDDSDFTEEGGRASKKKKTPKTPGSVSTVVDSNGNPIVKIHEKVNERWEIVVSQSDGQFQQVSFVNSICTTKGGTHVNYVMEPLAAAILKKVAAKNKGGIELKAHHVKQHIFIFVNCLIVNPTFDSQTKETLTLKASQFGSTCSLSDKTITAVVKSPITETVLLWAQTKQQVDLKRKMKIGGSKGRDRILGIPKLEDANEAGGRRALECTLILTEGDSAKTSCLAGLSVVGRDKYGVFPLRGKLLNVRDASFKQLTENKELQNILTITGLEVGKKYPDPRGLRYGSIMIMTDQDHDGSHIKGLLISFLEHYWPDLLRSSGFLKEFVTPIVKVFRKKEELAFFTIPEYEQWKRDNDDGKGWKVKYYKGLGTSDDKEFRRYFSDLNQHQLLFDYGDEADFEAIDMAFNPKRAEDRKTWIQSFEEGTFLDHREKVVRYRDFVNKELVLFSKYDTERSIPNLMDGWKPAQRKVLFAVLKKNLVKSEMKVAQLAAYAAEQSCYHHGEESLQGTIVNMAQCFCGSNNLNILEPCGQFGSRKEGGKDASAARYIFTKLSAVARSIFCAADDELLTYNKEEGRVIEPRWYVPCIPLVLINGAEGIGTGWSCSVPNYNPRDVIANLKRFLQGEPMQEMMPWYRGFIGRMERQTSGKGYESVGIIEQIDDETLEITELPVRMWTQPYKEMLDAWVLQSQEGAAPEARRVAAPKAKAKAKAKAAPAAPARQVFKYPILDYRDNSTPDRVHFTIKMDPGYLGLAVTEGLEKVFKLRKAINTTNMTLFDPEGRVQKYNSELDIMREFARVRLDYYHKRKRHIMNLLQKEMCILSNKTRFVLEVVEGKLIVHKKKRAVLVAELRERGYDTHSEILARFHSVNETMQGEVGDDGVVRDADELEAEEAAAPGTKDYDYLVGMPLWNLTYEKVEDLKRQRQENEQELEAFRHKTPELLWNEDLDKLEAAIDVLEAQHAQDEEETEGLAKRVSLKSRPMKTTHKAAPRTKVKKEPIPGAPSASAISTTTATTTTATTTLTGGKKGGQSPARDFSLMERLRRKMEAPTKQSTLDSLLDTIGVQASKAQTSDLTDIPAKSTSTVKPKRPLSPKADPAPVKRVKKVGVDIVLDVDVNGSDTVECDIHDGMRSDVLTHPAFS
eukprot:Blabericola_migrator_1__12265@NODE_765_length_6607_cov_284_868043_g545_i0_p1_GENE_NODE_765_length_6607_cov_284_868043_g545_i0NODE_765_length_6607_cov_284_868043_g545_i0_p1_ORF_typecomplete_len1470_score322_53DNA_topoisoIV/PF00521_20/2_4e122TOPRIM_C/PF16898_5/6_7e50DNA_gyraseB/PF00204_25/6_8e38Toprim/PF01751_22/5_6e18HATPase_c/PF02518_26/6_2e09HATPase_c_3/PF13589_6/0_0021LOR/PF04525_12/0_67LOR/PF04525_12/7_1e02_NODE_765_length_6607_cov_284_868043_g545_i016186027